MRRTTAMPQRFGSSPLDGNEPHLFTSGQDSAPKWSPNGGELAFVSNRGKGLQAFVMRLDGGEAKAATHMKGGVYSVEWSPEGEKLLFTAKQEVDPSAKSERGEPAKGKCPVSFGASHIRQMVSDTTSIMRFICSLSTKTGATPFS